MLITENRVIIFAPFQQANRIPADGTGKTLNLSDAQMEALIAYLKKQLDFAVFDLSRVAP